MAERIMRVIETDLNSLRIECDGSTPFSPCESAACRLRDFSVHSGNIEVVFKNLTERLILQIRKAHYVFGCVAWLTNTEILDALATSPAVSIIVQKEDFLRPDSRHEGGFKDRLRRKYKALHGLDRYRAPGRINMMSSSCDPAIEPVRCMGIAPDGQRFAPRMHHKFLVFASLDGRVWRPDAVWTGSFNFTVNAGGSFENAVIIRDPQIANAYLEEWSQVAALSEPLDWSRPWVAPEWRVGT
jgi:phosphatidylserine/phosphatidylglycerophosphate/cardiolipin synthase-like enzyme